MSARGNLQQDLETLLDQCIAKQLVSAAEGPEAALIAAAGDLSAEALAKAESGMAEMSKVYDETGRELNMGAGDREHD